MEMLVKTAEVLVKIAVMMMAPGGVPAPPEARGREPPFFFFFLDLLPRWEKGFPSGPWLPWRGRWKYALEAIIKYATQTNHSNIGQWKSTQTS